MEANPRDVAGGHPDQGIAEVVRVRPFRELIERGPGQPAIDLIGRVQDSAFQLLALGREIPLVTAGAARDERGQFADIAVGEWTHGEIRVRVELEYEEPIPGVPDMPPGGEIALFWGEDLQARAELELAKRGMDPRRYIVLAPAAASSLTVHFDFDGSPNGTGFSGPPTPRVRTH